MYSPIISFIVANCVLTVFNKDNDDDDDDDDEQLISVWNFLLSYFVVNISHKPLLSIGRL